MDEVYEYLKRTLKKTKLEPQVKVPVEELIQNVDVNVQTVYRQLRSLSKRNEVKNEVIKVKRYKANGKMHTFKLSYWWINDE